MVKTNNSFGDIVIADEAIVVLTAKIALDCYGVVSLATKNLSDSFSDVNTRHSYSKCVKIETVDNHIKLDLYVILKYGVSLNAVCESLKNNVKYSVEKFTGMIVDSVNVNVMGVKV